MCKALNLDFDKDIAKVRNFSSSLHVFVLRIWLRVLLDYVLIFRGARFQLLLLSALLDYVLLDFLLESARVLLDT